MRSEVSKRPRKLPKQERSRVTVEAILDATARVLVQEGYDKASTKRVAVVAGVSIGSLYQYFPNKESLVVALYERHLCELLTIFGRKFEEVYRAPLADAVRELVRASMEIHAVDPELHRVLVEQVPRAGRSEQDGNLERRIMEETRAFLEARREEILPQNPRMAAFVVTEAVEALAHATVLDRPEDLDDEELVDEISALIIGYLSPRTETHA
ncbi:MAG: TetR/AcrR family transcriptional regulator [Rubrobacter sp.]